MIKPLQVFSVQVWNQDNNLLHEVNFVAYGFLDWLCNCWLKKPIQDEHFSTISWGVGGGEEKNRARSCLLVTKRVQWGKGVKSRSQRETMQMWEGEIGGAEKCPHYAYGIHTELCRTVWDIGWQGILKWVLDATQRYKEKPVHQQETVVQPASERGWGKGVGFRDLGGVEVDRIRQHARANLKCNHHWKKYESLSLLN